MDLETLKNLPREVQVVLGGSILYIIFSFFDWQQVSFNSDFGGGSFGYSEWRGFGVITALVAIVLLVWEIGRLLNVQIGLGSVTPGQVSLGLALLLLLFTIITFGTHNEARHWPAWVGLVLSLVIAAAALMRAKVEGVAMPEIPRNISLGSAGGGATAAAPPPPPSPPPAAPAAADETPPGPDSSEA